MKLLCVGDLHISHTRLTLCSNVLDWVLEVATTSGVDGVVYLGDEHDTHSVIRSECNSIWSKHLLSALDLGLKVYWILGNHAMWKANDATYTALDPFLRSHPNLTCITKSLVKDGLGFVPYLTNSTWLESTKNMDVDIVFTHNTFAGADYGFKIADGGIPLSEIRSRLVISGHIHKSQLLVKADSTVMYPGTPYAWSGSDIDQDKSLTIVDTETLKTYIIDSPFSTWRRIDFDVSTQANPVISTKIRSKDHVVLKIKGTRAEVKAWIASSELTKFKETYFSVSVSTEFTDSAKINKIASIKTSDTKDAINHYFNHIYKSAAPAELVKLEVLFALGLGEKQ